MTQYRTNNPLGSMAPRDLFDNAQNVDNWSNGEEPFYEDRFGVMRRSFSGMNFEFEAAQDGRDAAFEAQMAALGYVSKGAYAAGVVLERYNEYVVVPGVVSGGTPAFYRPGPNAELPLTLEGDWGIDGPLLVMMSADDALRQELAADEGAALVGYRGQSLAEYLDEFTGSPFKTPEEFGAIGDGIADDTDAIAAWWASGSASPLMARKTYRIGKATLINVVVGARGSLCADLRGAVFTAAVGRPSMLRVEVAQDSECRIMGGAFLCAGLSSNGIVVDASAEGVIAARVEISGCSVLDTRGLVAAYWSSSVRAISIAVAASIVIVERCVVDGVNRDYVEPGSTASVGISITEVIGVCQVTGNLVSRVQSPGEDADADGISVFSRDRLLDVRQPTVIIIEGNRLIDNKDRHVKVQATGAFVQNNYFANIALGITSSFRCVDIQFGGCHVLRNHWELMAVSGAPDGSDVVFVNIQIRNAASFEQVTTVEGNTLNLARSIRYLVLANVFSGSKSSRVIVRANNVRSLETNGRIFDNLARYIGDVDTFTRFSIELRDNTYEGNRECLLYVDSSTLTKPAGANKIGFIVVGNRNTRATAIAGPTISSDTPYINGNDVLVAANTLASSGEANTLEFKSLTLSGIREGSSFYYATDGGAGGITDAPGGYNRYVGILKSGGVTQLAATGGDVIVRAHKTAAWRRIVTAAL